MDCIIAKNQLKFRVEQYAKVVLSPIVVTLIITIPFNHVVCNHSTGWSQLLLSIAASIVSVGICAYCFVMTKAERTTVFNMIYKALHK